ncbi:MAG: bifunctional pyr operon transcriptional regulator/uracil phosphoribosyltransferase PyrR [Deltaproteobacteria bacterium]|nr:bifunctional pyr operon transcriptional regulator/uracil phosphoribosyltransferase PyrR [Deltaproteobacteria bacterium]
MASPKESLNGLDIRRTLERLVCEILERVPQEDDLALIGIERRGAELAARIQGMLAERLGRPCDLGRLDINLYRDDWTTLDVTPRLNSSRIPFAVDGRPLLLVDDVLFSGRTVRAALEAILDYGRPKWVKLLVLVDRGHRELPIQPDFVGKIIPTTRDQHVDVHVSELDGRDQVVVS